MNYRWRFITLLVFTFVAMTLVGCGGDDGEKTSGGEPGTNSDPTAPTGTLDTSTLLPPTHTPLPPPPRERLEPEGDPYNFEPPFSVGDFVRQTLRGNATAVQAGGQQATYRNDSETIVLKIYHFNRTADAIATVEDTLNASNIVAEVGESYISPAVTFGVVQDKHGAYLAAWSNYHWAFMITAPDSLDALNVFLESFAY